MSCLLLAGYGFDLLGECCEQVKQTQVEGGKLTPTNQNSAEGQDCQCVCHHAVPPISMSPSDLVFGAFVVGEAFPLLDEIPPDAVPFGIEYPPQLA